MKTIVGVDENGLGPMLGPLLTTAVTIEIGRYEQASLAEIGLRYGVTDSKQSSAFGKMRFAESLALATVEAIDGKAPNDVDALFASLSLDGLLALRAPCPPSTAKQCWSSELTLPHFGGSVEEGREILASLRKHKIKIQRARSVISCAGVLNAQLALGHNKLIVNLGAFERLILDARRTSKRDVVAYCGMIGGLRSYVERFAHFPHADVIESEEKKGISRYRIANVGEVLFEVDADASHLPVAWASLIGKYVRELAMARLNAYYTHVTGESVAVSGYHDPVTKRFVVASEPKRRRLGIVDECFRRAR